MTLDAKKKKYLSLIYSSPSKAGSFQSPSKLYHAVKRQGKFKISLADITEWIKEKESYTLNKEVRSPRYKPQVISPGINGLLEFDLADLTSLSKWNSNFKYLLGGIDVFSRRLYVRPLKTKASPDMIKAFKDILKEIGSPISQIRADRGSEFRSAPFTLFLKDRGIGIYHSHGTSQSPYIERVWKSLKLRLKKFMFEKRTKKYINVLQSMVLSYNNSFHSSLGISPKQVTKNNEDETRYMQYLLRQKRVSKPSKDVKYKYKIGESVRISKRKNRITNEYVEKFSREIYYIHRRIRRERVPAYFIKDADNDVLMGSFYQDELQSVKEPASDKLYEIDEIIKRRVKNGTSQVYISFKGYHRKFNTWMDEKDLSDYER